MDFALPEELQLLKDNIRRFVDTELIPLEREVADKPDAQRDLAIRLRDKADALGLRGFDVPEDLGGLGLGMLPKVIIWSETARTTALPARLLNIFGPNVSPILYSLTGEAREKYLLPVISGEKLTCFAQTEPDAGSDPGGMRTRAVRDGDFYVLNGVKRYITGAENADFMQVFAVTDPEKGSRGGITGFIVDMNTPGVRITARESLMIDDRPCEIVLENVRTPVGNVIGREGDGFRYAQSWLNAGRIRHGARAIGVIERCLDLATAYSKQRKTFGKPLSERQAVQWPLLDSYMDLHQLRLMVHCAAWKFDRGEDVRADAYMVKIFGDERSFRAADRCMQIFGGLGLSKELPIERFFRDQRSMMITEGPVDVLRMALARLVLA